MATDARRVSLDVDTSTLSSTSDCDNSSQASQENSFGEQLHSIVKSTLHQTTNERSDNSRLHSPDNDILAMSDNETNTASDEENGTATDNDDSILESDPEEVGTDSPVIVESTSEPLDNSSDKIEKKPSEKLKEAADTETSQDDEDNDDDDDEKLRRQLLNAQSQKKKLKKKEKEKRKEVKRKKERSRKKSLSSDIDKKRLNEAESSKVAVDRRSRSKEKIVEPKKSRVHHAYRANSESDDDDKSNKRKNRERKDSSSDKDSKDDSLNKRKRREPSSEELPSRREGSSSERDSKRRQQSSRLHTPDKSDRANDRSRRNGSSSPSRKRHRFSNENKSNSSGNDRLDTSSQNDLLDSSLSSIAGYTSSPANTPSGRDNKAGWYDMHEKHNRMAGYLKPSIILCGDSIIAGLARYNNVWSKHFRPLKALNMGIGGDRTQHVLWRVEHFDVPQTTKVVILHCGTNNIDRDSARDIAFGVASVGLAFQERIDDLKIIITALLPRDPTEGFRRRKIRKVNLYLKYLCKEKLKDFYFMKHSSDWILNDGSLNEDLFYTDNLHLIEEGNDKFAQEIVDMYNRVLDDNVVEYSDDEEIVDFTKDDYENDRHRGDDHSRNRFSFQRRFVGGERRGRQRSRSPDRSYSSGRKRYRSRSNEDRSTKQQRSPYKWSRSNNKNDSDTPNRWKTARVQNKLMDKEEFDKLKQTLTNVLRNDDGDDVDKDEPKGTVKSIDISLDERKRIEARKAKFGSIGATNKTIPIARSTSKKTTDLDRLSERSKAEVKSEENTSKPSDLVRRIHRSQLNTRLELKNQQLASRRRRNSLVAYDEKEDSQSQSSQDESEKINASKKNKKMKKFLSDYASNSEPESD